MLWNLWYFIVEIETMKKHLKEAFKPVLQHYAGAILVLFSGWISRTTSLSNISLQNRTSSSRKWGAHSDLLNDPRAANTSLTSTASCHNGWVDKYTEVNWWWLGRRRPSEDSAGTQITKIPGYFTHLTRIMSDVWNVQCCTKKGCCVSVWKWSRRENPASSENRGVTAGGHRSFGFQSSLSSYWFLDYTRRQQRGELYQQLHTFTSLSITLLRSLLKTLQKEMVNWPAAFQRVCGAYQPLDKDKDKESPTTAWCKLCISPATLCIHALHGRDLCCPLC